MFETLLDPVFKPLLELSPVWAIVIISFVIALFINLIYKWMTDQDLMKSLRGQLKTHQAEMKSNKDNPKKMMEMQKKAMEVNMKYMMHSMRPTLITFLPIIIIFGWLNANLAFEPLAPNEPFSVSMVFDKETTGEAVLSSETLMLLGGSTQTIDGKTVSWEVEGGEGLHTLDFTYGGNSYIREVLITSEQRYKPLVEEVDRNGVASLNVNNKPLKPLNLFGWKLGWLGTYIISSLVFSIGIKKLMKLH